MTPQLAAVLERVHAEVRPGEYYVEESKERERSYIAQASPRWHDTLELARKYLGDIASKSVLDIGVTPFTLALPKFFGSVHALDLTNALATRCSRQGVNLISGDLTQENSTANVAAVDCIFFLEVIEHLHVNPVDLLRRLRSRLTEGGVLMVSTCNMMCLGNRVRMVCNRKLRHFDYPPFQKPQFAAHGFGHDRIYSPAELREYLRDAGFRSIDTFYPLAGDAHLLSRGGYSPGLVASYALKRVFPSLRDTMLFVGKR